MDLSDVVRSPPANPSAAPIRIEIPPGLEEGFRTLWQKTRNAAIKEPSKVPLEYGAAIAADGTGALSLVNFVMGGPENVDIDLVLVGRPGVRAVGSVHDHPGGSGPDVPDLNRYMVRGELLSVVLSRWSDVLILRTRETPPPDRLPPDGTLIGPSGRIMKAAGDRNQWTMILGLAGVFKFAAYRRWAAGAAFERVHPPIHKGR